MVLGYGITGKDVITLEPKIWKYTLTNCIHPFLNSFYEKPEMEFPDYVREYGISVTY